MSVQLNWHISVKHVLSSLYITLSSSASFLVSIVLYQSLGIPEVNHIAISVKEIIIAVQVKTIFHKFCFSHSDRSRSSLLMFWLLTKHSPNGNPDFQKQLRLL
jgi:hypothetical protein